MKISNSVMYLSGDWWVRSLPKGGMKQKSIWKGWLSSLRFGLTWLDLRLWHIQTWKRTRAQTSKVDWRLLAQWADSAKWRKVQSQTWTDSRQPQICQHPIGVHRWWLPRVQTEDGTRGNPRWGWLPKVKMLRRKYSECKWPKPSVRNPNLLPRRESRSCKSLNIGVQSLMVMSSKLWRFEWSERGKIVLCSKTEFQLWRFYVKMNGNN